MGGIDEMADDGGQIETLRMAQRRHAIDLGSGDTTQRPIQRERADKSARGMYGVRVTYTER